MDGESLPEPKQYYEAPAWYFVLRDQEIWANGYNTALADVRVLQNKEEK